MGILMGFALNKLGCSKQALCLNILAWYDEKDKNYIGTIDRKDRFRTSIGKDEGITIECDFCND